MSTYTGTGTTIVLTSTIPADNTDLQAADVNVPFETLLDNDAALAAASTVLTNTKVAKAGDTMTGALDINNGTLPSLTTSGGIVSGGDVVIVGDSLLLTITSVSNTTPQVVTTSTPHPWQTGWQVTILGNSAANGPWVIVRLSSTTFSLVGSTANGLVTGGAVQRDAEVMYGTPRFYNRTLTNVWAPDVSIAGTQRLWIPGDTSFGAYRTFQDDPTAQTLRIFFDIDCVPQGASIVGVVIFMRPGQAHTGVPSSPPLIAIVKMPLATGVEAVIPSTNNAPSTANVTAYQAYFGMTATLTTPEIVDKASTRYYCTLLTETGTNATDDFNVFGAIVTYSAPGKDQS
jgi:hypothetical protein